MLFRLLASPQSSLKQKKRGRSEQIRAEKEGQIRADQGRSGQIRADQGRSGQVQEGGGGP